MKLNDNTYTKINLNNKEAEAVLLASLGVIAEELSSCAGNENRDRTIFLLGNLLQILCLTKQFDIDFLNRKAFVLAARKTAASIGIPEELFCDDLI